MILLRVAWWVVCVGSWLVPLFLLFLWQFAVQQKWVPQAQAAAPLDIGRRLWELVTRPDPDKTPLVRQTLLSVGRLAAGVALGTGLAVLTGVCAATSRYLDRLASPTIQFTAGLPVVVWIPFAVMFFGTEEQFRIAMVAITTYFLVHLYTFHAVRSVEKNYLELAAMYEKRWWARFRHILMPSAIPAILSAVRTSLAFGWVVICLIEYAAATRGREGLGWFILDAREGGQIENEFAGLLLLGLVAFACDRILALWQRRQMRWSDSFELTLAQEPA